MVDPVNKIQIQFVILIANLMDFLPILKIVPNMSFAEMASLIAICAEHVRYSDYFGCLVKLTKINYLVENGQQLMYDPNNNWCDWPNRVQCGDRPICDEFDENCQNPHSTTPKTSTSKPSTPRPTNKCQNIGKLGQNLYVFTQ